MPTSAVTGTKQLKSAGGDSFGPKTHTGTALQDAPDESDDPNTNGFVRQRSVTRANGVQVIEELQGKMWVTVEVVG